MTYITSGEELKEFARDNTNIGQTATILVEAGGSYYGICYLYCYDVNDNSHVQIEADLIDGVNIFDGDILNFTGIYEGRSGGGGLKFRTIEMELF